MTKTDYIHIQKIISVLPDKPQPTITISLESTGIFLGVLVSLTVLLGLLIKTVSSFNKIASDIHDLRDDIKNHSTSEGHEKLVQQVRILQTKCNSYENTLALHLQNFENRKEAVQFLFGQINEKIDNRSERIELEVKELKNEVKEIQGFLRKREDFVIRNRSEV
jgi:septal ring factor EnvC (AmiA/AmiB activator)